MALINLDSEKAFKELQATGDMIVVHFWANWAPQCAQMDEVMVELAKINPRIKFAKLEAEAVPEVSVECEVVAVPTFVIFQGPNKIDRVDGADAGALTSAVNKCSVQSLGRAAVKPAAAFASAATTPGDKEALTQRLKELVNAAPVIIFIKGTPAEPRCGFSRQLINILKEQEVEYSSFDILSDEDVRQGLKEYSNWPTYPQMYVNGELVGGLDIIKELIENNEFKDVLPQKLSKEALNKKLKELVNKESVMLFMKGSPEAPRCGFSRTTVQMLKDEGVTFGYYDILGDEEVRQGLKEFSNWPTYPQVYVKGELIGGLDILKELKESGELKESLSA